MLRLFHFFISVTFIPYVLHCIPVTHICGHFLDEFDGKIRRYSAFLFLGRLRAPPPIHMVFYSGLRLGIAL